MRAHAVGRTRCLTAFSLVLASVVASGSCHGEPALGAGSASVPLRSAGRVRPAVHAGSWYPAEAQALRAEIEHDLEAARAPSLAGHIVAFVGPHAGLRYSGGVAASVYAALRRAPPKRIFLLGPSHHHAFAGIALPAPDLAAYGTPLGDLAIDREAVARLRKSPGFDGPADAHDDEHSLEMHAIFIAAVAPRALLVPLVVGDVGGPQEASALAHEISPLIGPDDVVIASSDFTHYGASYGYVPFTTQVPERLRGLVDEATAALVQDDAAAFYDHLRKTGDTICGREPILVMLGLLPPGTRGERLAFDTSGRMTGSYETSVSYVAMAFASPRGWGRGGASAAVAPSASSTARAPTPLGTGPSSRSSLAPSTAGVAPSTSGTAATEKPVRVLPAELQGKALLLARRTLELVLDGKPAPDATELGLNEPVWQKPYATFVTLEHRGALRGCIGHISAVGPLWKDIRDNAVAAALEDPRFTPVGLEELRDLDIEVSILTPLTPVSGPEGFVVGRHGVVLLAQGRRAVFLPQVAVEQGWDREMTLSHLSLKAGLEPDAWRSAEARFEVFEAQVFSETKRH